MPVFYGAIDLSKNELRSAVVQNLTTGTQPAGPLKGQLYMDTTDNNLKFWDGSAWVSCRSAGALTPASTVTTQAVGDAAVVGASTNYAREDHKHGREAFGAVTAEATFGASSANGAAATVARSDHQHGNPTHVAADHSTIPLSTLAAATANVNMGNFRIVSMADPVAAQDAATRSYVDTMVVGLSWKDSVRVASTANIATMNGALTIDGVLTVVGNRVLVKNQTTASANGIYVVNAGSWTRTQDGFDLVNATCWVEEGTTQADTAWVCTTNAPITIGTTPTTWVQFGGGQTYSAGTGLTLTGNTIDVIAADTTVTVNADSIQVNQAVMATRAYADSAAATATVGMAKKYAAALTGTTSPETVTHNLNTRDIHLAVYNGATPYTAVEVDWDATTVNTAVVRYSPNLGAGYRCVVVG